MEATLQQLKEATDRAENAPQQKKAAAYREAASIAEKLQDRLKVSLVELFEMLP